jgi:hypothetical protein
VGDTNVLYTALAPAKQLNGTLEKVQFGGKCQKLLEACKVKIFLCKFEFSICYNSGME